MKRMLLWFSFYAICWTSVATADEPPPSAVNVCDAMANTGGVDCVLEIIGYDKCPGTPSSPCRVPGVTCELSPISGVRQCWFSQEYSWRLRGHKLVNGANVGAHKFQAAGPGESGLKVVPAYLWQRKVCETRYSCFCATDIVDGEHCAQEKCGELYMLNINRDPSQSCVGQAGGSGPGSGGPGGAQ